MRDSGYGCGLRATDGIPPILFFISFSPRAPSAPAGAMKELTLISQEIEVRMWQMLIPRRTSPLLQPVTRSGSTPSLTRDPIPSHCSCVQGLRLAPRPLLRPRAALSATGVLALMSE